MPKIKIEYDDRIPDDVPMSECVGISDTPWGSEPIIITRVIKEKIADAKKDAVKTK